jgi:phasin family protein
MQNTAGSMIQSLQHQVDASRHITDVVFDGTTRVEHLMIETTRKALDEQMKFYQALAATRDPQGLAALQTEFISRSPEQMSKVQQELMKIVVDAQHQIADKMEQYKVKLNGGMSPPKNEAVPVFNQLPNGLSATSAITSVYSLWENAFKESVAMANRTMAAALAPPTAVPNGVAQRVTKATGAHKSGKRK